MAFDWVAAQLQANQKPYQKILVNQYGLFGVFYLSNVVL